MMCFLRLCLVWTGARMSSVAWGALTLVVVALGCGEPLRELGATDASTDPYIVDGSVQVDAYAPEPSLDASLEDELQWRCPEDPSCDPVDGGGCEPEGPCVLGAGGEATCEQTPGEGGVGAPCQDAGDCGVGLGCFATREGGAVCDSLCCAEEHCGGEERCGAGTFPDGVVSPYGRCHPGDAPCEVLDPVATCEPGEACYPVTATGVEGCRPAGARLVDEPCHRVNDCAPGLACRGLTGSCKRLCALGEPYACPPDEGECSRPDNILLPEGVGLCSPVVTFE